MTGLTPLEKAIVRAVLRGADTRDKIRKEFRRYFDSWDIDRVVEGLIERGVLETYTKGMIRKSERIRVTSLGEIMERRQSVIPQAPMRGPSTTPGANLRRDRPGSGPAPAARGAVSPGTGYYVSRPYRDTDTDEDYEYEEEREEGSLLDNAAEKLHEAAYRAEEALEEAKEEAEELLDKAEDTIEDLLDDDEEREEEY